MPATYSKKRKRDDDDEQEPSKKPETKRRPRILNHLIAWQDNRCPSFDIQLFIANFLCVHLDLDPTFDCVVRYQMPFFRVSCFPQSLYGHSLCAIFR